MRVVAENTDTDVARRRATIEVSSALIEMTANLMRVVRGAGKPDDIVRQIQALGQALSDYHKATGMMPAPDVLAEILSIEHEQQMISHLSGPQLDRLDAQQSVVRGALQVAASRLLGQKTPESVGRQEMDEAINAIGKLNEEMRGARQPAPRNTTNPVERLRRPKQRS